MPRKGRSTGSAPRPSRPLRDRKSFLAVNYLRKVISQNSGGHISPVAAYHEGEDRFLILDVSRYKYPPVWVKAAALWDAMAAVDQGSKQSRGYLTVRVAEEPRKPPAEEVTPTRKPGTPP